MAVSSRAVWKLQAIRSVQSFRLSQERRKSTLGRQHDPMDTQAGQGGILSINGTERMY